jgi:hypothetical protein
VNLDLTTLPVDVGALHALVRDLAAQMTGERAELARTKAEIDKLRLIIARLQRTQFGRRSEQIDHDQLALGLEDLDADIASIEARAPAARNGFFCLPRLTIFPDRQTVLAIETLLRGTEFLDAETGG